MKIKRKNNICALEFCKNFCKNLRVQVLPFSINHKLNMRSILLSFSLIFLLISCATKEEKTQIRFVNLNGKPRNISMRYPEKNVEALNKKMPNENISFDESIDRSINNMVGSKKTPAPQENQAVENAAVSYNLPAESAPVESGVVNKDEQNQEVVEYDLSEKQSPAKAENKDEKLVIHEVLAEEEKPLKNLKNKADKKAFKLAKAAPKEADVTPESKAKSGKYFVQVGAFSNNSNAQKLLTKMEKFHDGAVKKLSGNDKTVYRVWLGPLKNKGEAAALAKKISAKNQAAIVVKDK